MKKQILGLLLTLGLTASLTACSGGDPAAGATPAANSPAPSAADSAAPQPAADGYVFRSGGAQVAIGEDMADVLAALGEAQSYFEAASCAFDGLDKTYTYSGFSITTCPEGERDFVNSILLTDDSVSTPEGVYIGSAEAEVVAAYGDNTPSETGVLTYTAGNTALNFILKDGAVASIEYLPA